MVAECNVTLLVFNEVRLPYEVVMLYFTCESAGTAVLQVMVAALAVVLELIALIHVCAFALGITIETEMRTRRNE